MQNNLKHLDIVIGRNLKLLRLSRGMTQTTLADSLGLTFQQIQKYETGTNRISASRLIEIARILQATLYELLPADGHFPNAQDIALGKDTSRLLRAFQAISDGKLRNAIIRLVRNTARIDARSQTMSGE